MTETVWAAAAATTTLSYVLGQVWPRDALTHLVDANVASILVFGPLELLTAPLSLGRRIAVGYHMFRLRRDSIPAVRRRLAALDEYHSAPSVGRLLARRLRRHGTVPRVQLLGIVATLPGYLLVPCVVAAVVWAVLPLPGSVGTAVSGVAALVASLGMAVALRAVASVERRLSAEPDRLAERYREMALDDEASDAGGVFPWPTVPDDGTWREPTWTPLWDRRRR